MGGLLGGWEVFRTHTVNFSGHFRVSKIGREKGREGGGAEEGSRGRKEGREGGRGEGIEGGKKGGRERGRGEGIEGGKDK